MLEQYGYPLISKAIAKNVYDYRSAERKGFLDTSYAAKQFNGTYINPHNGELSPYNCEKWKFLTEAPFKISHRCCNVMKKNPAHNFEKSSGLKPIIGTMADESRLRKSQWILTGCNSFDNNKPSSKTMSFWKESEVLEYIVENKISIPSVYSVSGTNSDYALTLTPIFELNVKLGMMNKHAAAAAAMAMIKMLNNLNIIFIVSSFT